MSSHGAVFCGMTASRVSNSSPKLLSPEWAVSGGFILVPPEGGVGKLAETSRTSANALVSSVCAHYVLDHTNRQPAVITKLFSIVKGAV